MKTKAKLILAMSVLTAGVVAAGATGTFAWFTTNRAAQLAYSTVTAQKNAGNLDVSMGQGTSKNTFETGTKATSDGHDFAYVSKTASALVSDVSSGDGLIFAKPIWKTVAGNNQYASSFKDGIWGTDYMSFWFKVENTGNNALDVYLNSATAITPKVADDANDIAAAKYARVAINAASKSESNDVAAMPVSATNTWLLENTSARDQQYVAMPENKSAETLVVADKITTGETLKSFVLNDSSKKMNGISSTSKPTNQKLCSLKAYGETGYTAYFVVTVWLEGTKDDGTDFDKAAGGQFDVLLDLAGVEAA